MEKNQTEELIPLSAEEFIKALQRKPAKDKHGNSFEFTYNQKNKILTLNNFIVEEYVELKNEIIYDYHIEFTGGIFENDFELKNGYFEGNLFIRGTAFKKSLIISGGTFQKWMEFQEGVFNDLWISGGVFKNTLKFAGFKQEFHGVINISNGLFEKGIFINGFCFHKNIHISGGIFSRELEICASTILKRILIDNGSFSIIKINSKSFIEKLVIVHEIDFDFSIENSQINALEIQKEIKKSGYILIKRTSVNTLIFGNLHNEGQIVLADITIGAKTLFINKNYDRTQDLSPSMLKIKNSNLGKTSFFNIKLDIINNIIIQNSRLSAVETTTNHLPISSEKAIFTDENGGRDPKYLEELYNMLYLAMQKQGNRTQEIKYYGEYLEWHRKNKRIELKENFKWRKIFSSDWYTPVSLWLHKKTSDYGSNWVKSFLLIIGFGIIFYFAYSVSLPEIPLGFEYLSWENFGFHFKHYTQFILPTHKMDFMSENSTGWTALWDILGRIVIGFLIYQTITAFRRFGKK